MLPFHVTDCWRVQHLMCTLTSISLSISKHIKLFYFTLRVKKNSQSLGGFSLNKNSLTLFNSVSSSLNLGHIEQSWEKTIEILLNHCCTSPLNNYKTNNNKKSLASANYMLSQTMTWATAAFVSLLVCNTIHSPDTRLESTWLGRAPCRSWAVCGAESVRHNNFIVPLLNAPLKD